MKLFITTKEWLIINFLAMKRVKNRIRNRMYNMIHLLKNIFNVIWLFDKCRNTGILSKIFFCNVLIMYMITLEINIGS